MKLTIYLFFIAGLAVMTMRCKKAPMYTPPETIIDSLGRIYGTWKMQGTVLTFIPKVGGPSKASYDTMFVNISSELEVTRTTGDSLKLDTIKYSGAYSKYGAGYYALKTLDLNRGMALYTNGAYGHELKYYYRLGILKFRTIPPPQAFGQGALDISSY